MRKVGASHDPSKADAGKWAGTRAVGGASRSQQGQLYVRRSSRRKDPAPSRLAFRLNRLWLTPIVRSLTRIGVPTFAVVLGLGIYFGDSGRRADMLQTYEDIKASIQNRPEFMVNELKVEGASPEVERAVYTMLPTGLPVSSFNIDLDQYRETIMRLDAVADASISIKSGGVLDVVVTERTPVILWRTATGLEMLDHGGHRVATLIDRAARSDLPLIAGVGANQAVPEALAILKAMGPLLPKARGLIRVGQRRWDIVLEGDRRVMLPQDTPVQAVERLLAMNTAEDVLARDFTRIDLRDKDRPTIRLTPHAMESYRAIAHNY
ncbi:cell division protein FtsQ/DivIB [Thioclava litoralis]|uniref:Cell division protein FtsQ n=1 Tax=Thioclava litoralis TaxID=3076557 RepID=A0ABZ1E2I3_9RHOB|nr:cell division protein FtsQ/DivIB [Thioclava sp. FTW29]